MTSPDTLVADLADVSHDSELAPLCRMLAVGQGTFSLSIAVCNSPALRTRLIDAVRDQFPAFEVVTIPPQTIDVYGFVHDHVTSRDTAIFLVGLEASISDAESDDTTLRSLNASRDLWPTAFACPVVFWLPEYAARALSETARDFWRIRSHRFYFVTQGSSPTIRQPDTHEGRYLTWTSLSEDEKRTRIAELQQRLTQADRSSPDMEWHILNWSEELATLQQFVGNSDEALRIRRDEQLPTYKQFGDMRMWAVTMGRIADIFESRGDFDEALRIHREEELPILEQLGDVRERAVTMGKIADVFLARGELDESLRIRREEELPVYEMLGEVRERAVALGKIADILQRRGELDEALRIRREEELPVYEQLGDVRERAVTMGKIADIFESRGEIDDALRILREELLPTFERLGDVRSRAVTMGRIAGILQSRGELDEALRIHREEELPVFERLGDVQSRAMTMASIADILRLRGEEDEALHIFRDEVLPPFERLGDALSQARTMGRIAHILYEKGELDEALRIYREGELPIYERLGEVQLRAACQNNMAILFLKRNQGADHRRAKELLTEALSATERLKIPEAKQIRQLMRREGFLK